MLWWKFIQGDRRKLSNSCTYYILLEWRNVVFTELHFSVFTYVLSSCSDIDLGSNSKHYVECPYHKFFRFICIENIPTVVVLSHSGLPYFWILFVFPYTRNLKNNKLPPWLLATIIVSLTKHILFYLLLLQQLFYGSYHENPHSSFHLI